MKLKLVFCALIALGIPAAIFAESAQSENSSGLRDAVILIIRHAEETDAGHGLSSLGVARAKEYASYFKNFTIDGRAVKLDDIFAAKDSRISHRPRLTIEPTAEELGIRIDDRFRYNQLMELVKEIKSKPHGANILIVWHQRLAAIPILRGHFGPAGHHRLHDRCLLGLPRQDPGGLGRRRGQVSVVQFTLLAL